MRMLILKILLLFRFLIYIRCKESRKVSNITLPWQNDFKDDNFIQDPDKAKTLKAVDTTFNLNRNVLKPSAQNTEERHDENIDKPENLDKQINVKLKVGNFDSKDHQNFNPSNSIIKGKNSEFHVKNSTATANSVISNSYGEKNDIKSLGRNQELDSLYSNSLLESSLQQNEKDQKQITNITGDEENEQHQNLNLEEDNDFDSLRNVLQRRSQSSVKKFNKQDPTAASNHPDTFFNSPAVMEKLQPIIRSQLRTKTYMTLLLNGYKRVHYLKTLLNQMMTSDMCQRLKIKDFLSPTNSSNTWKKAALLVNEFEKKCSDLLERKRRNHFAMSTRRHRFK
eukprot:TCONS_00049049-protein